MRLQLDLVGVGSLSHTSPSLSGLCYELSPDRFPCLRCVPSHIPMLLSPLQLPIASRPRPKSKPHGTWKMLQKYTIRQPLYLFSISLRFDIIMGISVASGIHTNRGSVSCGLEFQCCLLTEASNERSFQVVLILMPPVFKATVVRLWLRGINVKPTNSQLLKIYTPACPRWYRHIAALPSLRVEAKLRHRQV